MSLKRAIFVFLAVVLCVIIVPNNAHASRIENMKDVPDRDDFDLGPTSFSIDIEPGQSITKTLQITNRIGETAEFFVDIEDFEGSPDPSQPVVLQGKESGRYSAKEWVTPELTQFTLNHGQRQFFDVTINVPKESVDTGDHYVSVLVHTAPKGSPQENGKNVRLTSRVGALFFIRIPGDIVEKGRLQSFEALSLVTKKEPVEFRVLFANSGTVRLMPSGSIAVKDIFGRIVGNIDIQPFNVLRNSVRLHSEHWTPGLLPGRYTAIAKIQKGYDNQIDVATVQFWYFPLKEIAIAIGVLLVIALLAWWIKKHIRFEISLKE